jgi:hypothetical protein
MRILQLAGEVCAIAAILVVIGVVGALTPITIYGMINTPAVASSGSAN